MKKAVNGIVGRIKKENKKEKNNLKEELRNTLRKLDLISLKKKATKY